MLKRDQDLMVKIKNFFGCGNISFNEKKGTCKYSVTSIQDVVKYIIPHFSKYPLRGTKYLDFLDFSKGIHLILEKKTLNDSSAISKNVETILDLINNMNTKRIFNSLFVPTHLTGVPLDPNYVSGFIEGDGSLILELKGTRKYRMSIYVDQHYNNYTLLDSLRAVLNIDSLLIVNKTTGVLKISKSGDKYFKLILIPFFIKYPLHGNKLVQLYKLLLILSLKESSELSKIEGIWRDSTYTDITVESISILYSKLSPVKTIYNSKEISVISKDTLSVTTYESMTHCALDMKISRKTIAKYLNTGLPYNGFIFNNI